jgi:hypothetical protein
MKRFTRFGGIALCLALVAGTAFAARQKLTVDFFFPGVDEDGFLDDGFGADGTAKVTYNTRSERLRVVGRATVENESGEKQVYDDIDVLADFLIEGDVVRDKYTVSKKGKARYIGVARDAEPDL